jgi:hypothetical protein
LGQTNSSRYGGEAQLAAATPTAPYPELIPFNPTVSTSQTTQGGDAQLVTDMTPTESEPIPFNQTSVDGFANNPDIGNTSGKVNFSSFEVGVPEVNGELTPEEIYSKARDFARMNTDEGAAGLLGLHKKYGDKFFDALATGGGGDYAGYYAIPRDRAELLIETVGVMRDGDNEALLHQHQKLKELSKVTGDKSLSYMADHSALGVDNISNVFHYSAPRMLDFELTVAASISGLTGHRAIAESVKIKGGISGRTNVNSSQFSNNLYKAQLSTQEANAVLPRHPP